jgi:Luciferase
VHIGGIIDMPFPHPIRDPLLAQGLAEEHHWVPNSGWITFRMRKEQDFDPALWLMRLSSPLRIENRQRSIRAAGV